MSNLSLSTDKSKKVRSNMRRKSSALLNVTVGLSEQLLYFIPQSGGEGKGRKRKSYGYLSGPST